MARSSTLRIDIIADGSKASRTMDSLGAKVGGFGKKLAVGAAVGAAGVAVAAGKLAVDSIKAASDVEQAMGAVESVFGKTADQVKKKAAGAATAVGLSQAEYANLATVLGSQLKNMGTAADQLAPKTDKLIGLGADLASTFGGSTADAVSAVSSLLKGERDPIERYGVSIKAADVAARLQAQGLDKLTGPAKAAAEANATLALLTEQTAAAQGSFTREADTAAGQQQRLTAQWTNAKAELGSGLLPIVTRVATFLTSRVMPAVQGAASTLAAKLGPAINQVGSFITTRLVPAAQLFLTWFRDRIVPGIRSAVLPVLAGLKQAWANIQAAIERNRPQLEKIGQVLRTVAEFIADKVAPVVGKVLGEAFKAMGRNISTTIDAIGWLVDKLQAAYNWMRDVARAAGELKDKLGGGLSKLGDKLNPFSFMAAPTPTGTAPAALVGPQPAPLAATPLALSSSAGSTSLDVGNLATVDARTAVNNYLTINVDGALDPVGVAEQIRQLLLDQARRTGRPLVVLS